MAKMYYGIDVSEHNGVFPFATVKASNTLFDFAIIRASWGHFQLDKHARVNIQNAKHAGVDYGLYHYSYATNDLEAKLEAESFLEFAKTQTGRTYPLVLDMEDADGWKSKQGVTMEQEIRTIRIWKQIIEGAGEYLMLYCNHDWWNRLRAYDAELIDSLDQWHAHWSDGGLDIDCGIWQFTSDGHMDGHNGRLDMNIAYKDYPSIITGKKPNSKPETTYPLDKYTDEQLADMVMRGECGNGEERKNRLGSRYNAVQAIVNKRLGAEQKPTLQERGRCVVKRGACDVTGVAYSSWVYDSSFYVYRIIGDEAQFATDMNVDCVIGRTKLSNLLPV